MSVASHCGDFPIQQTASRQSNDWLPCSVLMVIHSAVNHRWSFRCAAAHTSLRWGTTPGFIYLFWGTDPFGTLSWGRGGGGRCLGVLAASPGLPPRSPPAPFPMRPRSSPSVHRQWGRVPFAQPLSAPGWGGYTKVSGSSPPIGQFCKSAFKFPFLGEGEQKRGFFDWNSFPCM